MNATEQIALLRRACEMVFDASANGGDMSDRDWLAKWREVGFPWKIAIDMCREALAATATPPDDAKPDVLGKADPSKVVCPSCFHQFRAVPMDVHTQLDDATNALASQITETEIVTRERDAETERANKLRDAWLSRNGDIVTLTKERDDARLDRSAVLAQRDEALAKLAAANGELETERIRLAACGVIAGCNTPETYALNMRMDESYKCSSIDAVAAAVRREMDLRDTLAAAQKELSDIYAAKPEPEFSVWHPEDSEFYWIRRMERTISWEPIARCDKESVAIRIADALNGGGGK